MIRSESPSPASVRFAAVFGMLLALGAPSPCPASEDRLGLEPGQRVIIAGNTFAERMALFNFFETALHCAYPDHRLTVRNLGWSGDEVDLMPRPRNFGTFEEHLEWNRADVVILCFGMNESFAGEGGLAAWRERLERFVVSLKERSFNGVHPPRLVLVSPIAQEDLGSPYPTGDSLAARNRDLEGYARTMRDVARDHDIPFVNLFSETLAVMTLENAPRLTINGIHLSETGDYLVSQMMARLLGLIDRPAGGDPSPDSAAEKLRRLIYEKNAMHFMEWRPLNPYYIWGGRAWCWADDQPMRELEQIGSVVRDLDAAIWSAEKPAAAEVWARLPGQGPEVWEAPIDHAKFAIPGSPEVLPSVRRNGALAKDE